ncbi:MULTISPECIES: CHASE2 domain-containing protein [Calothrix]|uniref:CHASE2 domain-containing protein n=2 Tax=Calothrix TaxID=1186 RepID=A0ABR8A7G3_9CYAN|nr:MULTISPECIES: CHASE2 domain-containing protein [Calothrix]MBD2195809.1 CHASE2 domain-containing protein [Calothrix parietina FACHB-288]MBD2226442.1 CHASE2 domain-containing protein [Calothrix anomala FACHB-343]
MNKLVVFSFLSGDLHQGFSAVTAQVWDSNRQYPMKLTGTLPPAPELSELYHRWQLLYEALHQRLGSRLRIKIHAQDVTNISVSEFGEVCQQLKNSINRWLNSEPFQNIVQQLRTLLNRNDTIRVIFETNIPLLQRLPWHLWNFFDDYRQAEVALSSHEYEPPHNEKRKPIGKVKILAILGNSEGIDIDKDRTLLKGLQSAEIEFLVEPTRRQVDRYLWNQDWDILFFAGHSSSQADEDTGKIYLNQTESLTIPQLKNALQNAIARGLQLAIFNSCDSTGLARDLADLNIPQMIVMREPVPDLVAQEFLKNFLVAFAGDKLFYTAVREARERLQGWENDFPCASWLPVICQNPTTVPITWSELCGNSHDSIHSNLGIRQSIATILLSTAIATLSIIGLRFLGVFQTQELQAFDHIIRLRPQEEQDSRLLVVEVTEKDIQNLSELRRGLKSISDQKLAKLLEKLQTYQPRVIGIDIYRDIPDFQEKLKQLPLTAQLNQENVIAVCKGKDSEHDPQGIKPPIGVPVDRQGFTDAIRDPDGIIRRQILMVKQEISSRCTTPFSLNLQLAARYLYSENIQYELTNNGVIFHSPTHNKTFWRLAAGSSGGYQKGVGKVDLGGIQILTNYRNSKFEQVTVEDVLSGAVKSDAVKDKIILIGVTAQSLRDSFPTPDSVGQQPYQETPGLLIQAQMTSQIISAVLDRRPIIWVLPYWGDILWIWGWCLVSGLIVWPVRSLLVQICTVVTIAVVLYGVCTLILLIQGAWLPLIPSILGVIFSGGSVLVFRLSM